jgi:hypothetical protein
MADIKQLRAKYPQYNDMTDEDFADRFHAKYYSDMPIEEFDKKVGFQRKSTIQKFADGVGSLGLQMGSGVLEGVASLPGLPVELASMAKGVSLEGSNLEGWGAEGWKDFARRNIGEISAPEPTDEGGRMARKLGNFAGGAAAGGGIVGGVRGAATSMVPSLTGFAGSEVGRLTDQAGLTGGYGEVAGGIAGGIAPGLVKGSATANTTSAPSIEKIKRVAGKLYDRSEKQGVIVAQPKAQQLAATIKQDLSKFGYTPKLQTRVAAAIDELENNVASGNVTLKGLDVFRRVARAVGNSLDDSEKSISRQMVERVDDFIDGLQPQDLVTGQASLSKATSSLKLARDLWKRSAKSSLIEDAMEAAQLRTGSTWSGGNINNAIRQELRKLLLANKRKNYFSKAEAEMIRKVVNGSASENTLRLLGKLSPEGSGIMLLAGLGSAGSFGGVGVLPFAAGAAAKATADTLAKGNINRLSNSFRTGPQAALSTRQQLNQTLLEMQRRAKLAGQSAAPAIPGAVNSRER